MVVDNEGLQTLTVLFTDAVASTELRARIGDAAADTVQHAADTVVRAAVEQYGGSVVKTLGDGVIATFVSATSAVSAAELIQQQIHLQSRRDTALQVALRIGLAAGDVSLREGDVSGTPVVAAKRLCDLAEPNEVLVTEVVKTLCGSRGTALFDDLGLRELKGLGDAVPVSRLRWEPPETAESASHGVPLPSLLVGARLIEYVGRPTLLATLADELVIGLRGDSGAHSTLLAGEPGVGKTRTAAEVARRAGELGAIVLYGRCDEDMGAPYQPFVEALTDYAAHATDPKFGRLAGELRRLVPELRGEVSDPVTTDPRTEEYRLFEAVTAWLTEAAREDGLLLVLDDLHWADQPTLSLLRHLLTRSSTSSARLHVLATYRDSDSAPALTSLLADLRRLPGTARHHVTGLELPEVVACMELAAGHELDTAGAVLAGTLWAETEGNPLFVFEVLRHLRETGGIRQVDGRWVVSQVGAFEVPDSVREVVGRRLDRLSAATRAVLATAAVVGRNFSIDVVAAAANVDEDSVVDALDEARHARLVEEISADNYRFSHVLVRTTLYDGMSATRRRRAHRKVAAEIERLHGWDVVALAHHHLAAEPTGPEVVPAALWAMAAGEHALSGRALAEAELRLGQAAALLADVDPDVTPPASRALPAMSIVQWRARALCGLGEAQRDQGNPEFRDTLLFAGELARAAGDVRLLTRAVLGNDRGSTLVAAPDPRRVALIQAALHAVGPEPSADRARLLTRLVVETTFAGDPDRRRELTLAAESMARDLDDPRALAHVLVRTGMAAHRLTPPDESLARAVECSERADAAGDPVLRALARSWVSSALIVCGRVRDAAVVVREMGEIAADASPTVRLFARLAAIKFQAANGETALARAENDACLHLATELREPDAEMLWGAVAAAIAVADGAEGGLADAVGIFADHQPLMPNWRVAHAAFLAGSGRHDEARAVLNNHRLDPARLMEEPFAFQGPFMLASCARHLGDAALGSRVQHLLAPFAGNWSHAYLGILGPVSWALGWCSLSTGELDAAVQHLQAAWLATEQEGTVALQRLVGVDYLEALNRRGSRADQRAAGAVREELASRLGRDVRLDLVNVAVGARGITSRG